MVHFFGTPGIKNILFRTFWKRIKKDVIDGTSQWQHREVLNWHLKDDHANTLQWFIKKDLENDVLKMTTLERSYDICKKTSFLRSPWYVDIWSRDVTDELRRVWHALKTCCTWCITSHRCRSFSEIGRKAWPVFDRVSRSQRCRCYSIIWWKFATNFRRHCDVAAM